MKSLLSFKTAFLSAFVYFLSIGLIEARERSIAVFVALADNQHQGIVPVSERLGNGDDPERNLYWGAADGLKGVFDKSSDWRLVSSSNTTEENVLRKRVYRHSKKKAVLYAMAYKGSAIKECIRDFEKAVQSGSYDLVVFIGHNGLMDFSLPAPERRDKGAKVPSCIVLCCKSDRYFRSRIEGLGGKPILLTTQLMYPGAFILHAAVDSWLSGKGLQMIRESAGNAYAKNQKLSKRAGTGVFAVIKD